MTESHKNYLESNLQDSPIDYIGQLFQVFPFLIASDTFGVEEDGIVTTQ